jgi:hypothetical protein
MTWRAPDGGQAKLELTHAPPFRAADFYSVLKRAEAPSDHLDRAPGARRLATAGPLDAWLVPRRGAVCLVVRSQDGDVSACRRKVADVRTPLIVGVGPSDRSRRAIVAAFPDAIKRVTVEHGPDSASKAIVANTLLVADAKAVVGLRYSAPGSRGAERHFDRFPQSAWSFVLNAVPTQPFSIPPP